MSITSRLRGFAVNVWDFVPLPSSRGYVFVTIVVSMMTAGLSTWGVNQIQNRHNDVVRINSSFIDESRSFDAAIAAFVQALLHGQDVNGEPSQRIYSSLIKQSQYLLDAEKNLPSNDRHLVREYQALLLKFHEIVPQSTTVLDMQEFWNTASRILVLRNEIIRRLEV